VTRAARPSRRAAAFAEADEHLEQVLAELEGAANYQRWVLRSVSPYVHGDVVEIGAGRGTYTRELRRLGTSITAIEPSGVSIVHLRRQVEGLESAHAVHGGLGCLPEASFDAAVLLNVLEHIDDDADALRDVRRVLRPSGTVCIWVPAFELLYGRFDARIGHHRRYRRRQLERLLDRAGFDVVDGRYVNLPGFFAWLLVVRLLRAAPTAGRLTRVFDRAVVPVASALERHVRPPIGQSLLVIGRRRADRQGATGPSPTP
jgi:SAM-dependent methyltransferase